MSFDIEQIIIMVNLNINNEEEPFKLTSKNIYHPDLLKGAKDKLSEIPYITTRVKYPLAKLYGLARNGYKKIVRFFFDKKYFEIKLTQFLKNEKVSQNKDTSEVLKYNIECMLELLFPTYFPVNRNITSSFNEYILQKTSSEFSLEGANPFSNTSNFSYIKINNKIYTITKTIWLNDLLNHPIYRYFIQEFINYTNWAENEQKIIVDTIQKRKDKLLIRIKEESQRPDNLYIQNELVNFENNLIQMEKDNSRQKYVIDTLKEQFYDDLKEIIELFKSFFSYIDVVDNNKIVIDDLYSKVKDINEVFKRLTSNTRVTLKGISDKFRNKWSKIMEETKKISILQKIKENYISTNEIVINTQEEDTDVINELNKNYKRYIDFSEYIKNILKPIRESSNEKLQKSIVDYSENVRDKNGKLFFSDVMKYIRDEFINSKTLKYFKNPENIEIMNLGTCLINSNIYNLPHYEIYVSFDLIDGEYNEKNINEIKCKYRGLYLGQQAENYFSNYNKFDANQQRLFISDKENEDNEEEKQNVDKPQNIEVNESEEIKKGGAPSKYNRKTVKRKLISKRKTLRR
jgi:hypothetical protein